MGSAWAQRGWQGDAAGLKRLARHAGSLATKNVTLAADRDFHLNEVIQIPDHVGPFQRSEEHTSELQSRQYLVCRLLLEKKKQRREHTTAPRWQGGARRAPRSAAVR